MSTSATADPTSAILFYDGTCGLCNATVRFILDRERQHTLLFATLQGPTGEELIRRHPKLGDIDSVVMLEPGSAESSERVYVRSDAAISVARYLGGFWRVGVLALVIPRSVRDAIYDLIAKHRHNIVRGPAYCRVLDDEDRARFLD